MSEELIRLLTEISGKLDRLYFTLRQSMKKESGFVLSAWLDVWFDTYKAPKLRDKGYDLKHTIQKHVLPNVANKPLEDYTALDITAAVFKVESSRMRQVVYQIYDQAFREAVRAGLIDRNPVDNVDRPKHNYEPGRSLSETEERIFLEQAKSDKLYDLFRFYILTGCRPSEALAVTRSDIGPELLHIPGTKTDHAPRDLPISDPLKVLLDELPRGGTRLFPYVYTTASRHLKNICGKLSFTITLKDLRHTFGTRCIEAGVNMKTLQKWMGHSSFEVTANTYAHVLTDFERREAKKL